MSDLQRLPDTVDDLAEVLTAALPAAVDELHVAAELESRGITDAIARERYGHADVFTLAAELTPRFAWPTDDPDDRPAWRPRRIVAVLVHGPLYALPGLIFPAVFMELGAGDMLRALVLATGLGWVWSMATTTAAHRLVGEHRPRAAARLLLLAGATGLIAGALIATVVAVTTGGGPSMVAFAVAQLSYQLSVGILLFYRRERLVVLMLPVCFAGGFHLATGLDPALAKRVVLLGAMSAVLVAGAAVIVAVQHVRDSDPATAPIPRATVLGVWPSLSYAVLAATYLLYTDARYLTAAFDLSVAVMPLVLGMGFLEWRSHRFRERSAALLRSVRWPVDFRTAVWRLLLGELTACLLVLGTLGLAGLVTLAAAGVLTIPGALLIDAHLILGGAFFVGFVLANNRRFGSLLLLVGAVVGCYLVGTLAVAGSIGSLGEATLFLLSAAVLLVALTTALHRTVGDLQQYR